MIYEVLLIFPIYLIFCWIFFRFRGIINMANVFENFLNEVDTPKEAMQQHSKREFLKQLIESGQTFKISGKTPWTIARLDKASDKVIDKLYARMGEEPRKKNTDLMSRVAGVDNVQAMMKDINSNFLIKSRATEMMGKLTPSISLTSNTPMEILGSHIYDKCGMFLAPVSLFCTVFNHLDWESFARIAEERQAKARIGKDEIAADDHLAGMPELDEL